MSKRVDVSSGKLSVEDYLYLRDRGRLPADVSFEDDDDEGEYEDMKVAELRELCADRGLDESGNKADLVARLHEDDEGI